MLSGPELMLPWATAAKSRLPPGVSTVSMLTGPTSSIVSDLAASRRSLTPPEPAKVVEKIVVLSDPTATLKTPDSDARP